MVEMFLLLLVHGIQSLLQLQLLEKLEVCKANFHAEIILLVVDKLKVSFFFRLGQF